MNPIKSFLILFLLLIFSGVSLRAQQDSTGTIKIELKDGSVLIGKIISENENELSFLTLSNIKTIIPKKEIVSKEIITAKIVEGKLWNDDPNSTRLLFAPTGKALKAGKGYFSDYEIFFPFIAVGVTDFFTLAGGISLVPGAENQILYFAPKIIPYQSERYSISGGVLYIKVPEETSGYGFVYGVSTYNYKSTSSITVGLGFGFSGGEFADKPVLVLGWEHRTSKSIKIISENWFLFGNDFHLISFGVRFFGEHVAADFGLIYPLRKDSINGFPFIPWLGFAYNF